VFSIKISNLDKAKWPNLHFSDDDTLACIVTSPSEIASFLPQEKFQAFRKFPVKNCEDLSISPGYEGRFRLAALTPEVDYQLN